MPNIVRFDCYEVDLASSQLYKRGVRIPLRDKSLVLLAALLEHPGELVTREELRQRLWRDDVFVDFENNLNTIVARLRETLGDSSEHPRFIETLPKHGYRFIANVMEADGEHLETVSTVTATVGSPSRSRGWKVGAALGTAALLVVLGALNVGRLRNRLLGHVEPPRITSLAVLPLTNLSHDPEQEYFADGMTDALITELAKIKALKVISRTSAMHYKNTDKTAPQIAAELGVDGLLEGTVAREGAQVRINVQLIYGPSDKHLWAETYQHELPGILALQSEVAQHIAQAVRASLTPEEHARLARAQLVNPQAYDAYLKGRDLLRTRTQDDLQKALEYFETAIRIDPGFALAYAHLADTYSILADNKFLPPTQGFPKARSAARKALELDENLAEAHAAMALVLHAYDWDWLGGEHEINRAIQLNPGYATAHHWHALFLSQMGRHAEAIAEIREARSLDPFSPRISANCGNVLIVARQYQQAIQELEKALRLFPDDAATNLFLGRAFSGDGQHEQAISYIRRGLALRHEPPGSSLIVAHELILAGNQEEARKVIRMAVRARQTTYVPAPLFAQVYAALGEKDQAFAWLEKGYAERDTDMEWLRVLPALDPLRSDPRFSVLLRKMNLEP